MSDRDLFWFTRTPPASLYWFAPPPRHLAKWTDREGPDLAGRDRHWRERDLEHGWVEREYENYTLEARDGTELVTVSDASSAPPRTASTTNSSIGVMTGHFAVWGKKATIFGEGPPFVESFAANSMDATLRDDRAGMKVMYAHGRDSQCGEKPLGSIARLAPDTVGAYYEVPLFDAAYTRELVPGLRAGCYGASFRFAVVRERVRERPPRSAENPRGLTERVVEVARVKEFGPVVWGAYSAASATVES